LHQNLQFDKAIEIYEKEKKRYPVTSVQHLSLYHSIANCKNGKLLVQHPIDVKIENVGKNINTPFDEYAPVITADQEIMFFTSRRPGNLGGLRKEDRNYYEDIYISKYQNGEWSEARNMGSPINTEGQDAPISLSPDGHVLYIHRDHNGGDVYSCKLDGESYSTPQNLGEPINTDHWEPSVSISADGNTLYYSSNKPGGHGNRDLYVSYKLENGKWSKGKNLGPKINTLMDEDAPFIHPDGKTLYFSSQAHSSMGGFDIFKTVLLPNGEWTKPVNIGYPINTPDDDIYFVLTASGKYGYYASAGREDGLGGKDIYRITFPDAPADTTAPPLAFKPELSITLLKGVVSDADDNKPLFASMMIVDNEANDTISVMNSNKVSGKYLITLTPGKNYGIIASAPGYLFCSENVDIPKTQKAYQEIIKDIKLVPLKVGSKIILKNIFFDFDKSTLRPISKAELNRLVKILNDNPNMRIRIGGHTDNYGSDEYNQKLSENRAGSVVQYLIEAGIDKKRLEYKGYGESEPIDTNETPQGRQNNRRTEFEILTN
jgi:outer membrane protein OmpA-like peptidoglycan-associated protein